MGIERGIRLRIDRLVIDAGLGPLDARAVGAAAEAELGRLLAERGVPSGLGGVSRVAHADGGRFEVDRGAGAGAVGEQVARAVYRGLGR